MIKALLLMGGRGERFGSEVPKQFHRLAGKKVYLHTLERFVQSALFDEVILVCAEEWVEEVARESGVRVVCGGETRQESSYLGLQACGEETTHVVIHDAVRPFVTQRILEENVSAVKRYGAVDTCIPSSDTIVYAPTEKIEKIPLREHYWRGQTPQSFSYPLILSAHEKACGNTATDDCRLVLEQGYPVHIVRGEESNIKITTELDLFLAEQLLRLSPTALPPQGDLKGKRIAVVGGTGGIGQSICALLRSKGAEPLVIARTSQEYPIDLTKQGAVAQLFQDIGSLDGLINCFGELKVQELSEQSFQDIDALIATNLTALIYCCKCAQVKPGGTIINIASSSYSRGRGGYAVYSAAKAAVVNFTQALAEERSDLRVNVLIPQRTYTPLRLKWFPHEDPATLLTPSDVSKAVHSLLTAPTTGSLFEVKKLS